MRSVLSLLPASVVLRPVMAVAAVLAVITVGLGAAVAAPGVGGSAASACEASGSTLGDARVAYAESCAAPRVDCDPVGDGWTCSSEVLGDKGPGGTVVVSVPQPGCEVTNVRPVSATDDGSNDGNTPAGAIDGDLDPGSRWSSKGHGKWIVFDLGTVQAVQSLDIAWFRGDERKALFEVKVSTDGSSWSTALADGVSSGSDAGFERFDLAGGDARYLRVVGGTNSSGNGWNSIVDVQVGVCGEDEQQTTTTLAGPGATLPASSVPPTAPVTVAPTTTAAPTTTEAPTTTAAPTTTEAPTTTAAPEPDGDMISHDFNDGDMGPFYPCTVKSPNYSQVVDGRVKTYWEGEAFVSGDRMTAGAEFCDAVRGEDRDKELRTHKEGWMGFTMNVDEAHPRNSESAVAQVFGFDLSDAQIWTWVGLLQLEDGDLRVVHRDCKCSSRKVYGTVIENFEYGKDHDIVIGFRVSEGTDGFFKVWVDGRLRYEADDISFGLGDFDSNDVQTNQSYTTYKLGMYNHSGPKSNNEIRIIYYDDVTWYSGTDGYNVVTP